MKSSAVFFAIILLEATCRCDHLDLYGLKSWISIDGKESLMYPPLGTTRNINITVTRNYTFECWYELDGGVTLPNKWYVDGEELTDDANTDYYLGESSPSKLTVHGYVDVIGKLFSCPVETSITISGKSWTVSTPISMSFSVETVEFVSLVILPYEPTFRLSTRDDQFFKLPMVTGGKVPLSSLTVRVHPRNRRISPTYPEIGNYLIIPNTINAQGTYYVKYRRYMVNEFYVKAVGPNHLLPISASGVVNCTSGLLCSLCCKVQGTISSLHVDILLENESSVRGMDKYRVAYSVNATETSMCLSYAESPTAQYERIFTCSYENFQFVGPNVTENWGTSYKNVKVSMNPPDVTQKTIAGNFGVENQDVLSGNYSGGNRSMKVAESDVVSQSVHYNITNYLLLFPESTAATKKKKKNHLNYSREELGATFFANLSTSAIQNRKEEKIHAKRWIALGFCILAVLIVAALFLILLVLHQRKLTSYYFCPLNYLAERVCSSTWLKYIKKENSLNYMVNRDSC